MAESAAKRQLFGQEAQPLKNWTFYLDLKNYRNTKSLQRRIEEFGGRVEQFLSKEIKCVITNGDINGTQPLRKSPRSKVSNASINKPLTRAQGMLAKAKEKQSGRQKTNVLAIAKGLGIDVKHVDDVLSWLKRRENETADVNTQQTRVLRSNADGKEAKSNVRQLKSPFIKIEDRSRHYQPLFKELNDWPTIHFESQPPDCPFDPPSSRRQHRSSSGTSSSTKHQQFNGQTAKATGHNGSSQKVGYCEVCKANYRGLKRHLRGIKHKKNAADTAAYKELDATVRQGRTVTEYLDKLRAAQVQELEDSRAREIQDSLQNSRNGSPDAIQTPVKHVTPLKIIFSPRAGYSVVKHEAGSKGKPLAIANDEENAEVIVTKMPRKRCFDEYSVVWMSELTMKIKRSARILRETGREQGSVYVEFPVFKEQQSNDANSAMPTTSSEDSAVIKKYGDVQGKLRLSRRVLDSENHQGMEEFECPMYMESSEQ